MSGGGHCHCACRDCFDIAICDPGEPALCGDCEDAGCDLEGTSECERDDVYDDYVADAWADAAASGGIAK